MKKRLGIMSVTALILIASAAVAGVLAIPIGSIYTRPELASVHIQGNGAGSATVRTTGLIGVLTLDASDVPNGFDAPEQGCARLPFEQTLTLVLNPSSGLVEGGSRGQVRIAPGQALNFQARVSGNASCVRRNGRPCGQLVVDLELRGTLSDPDDPARVGLLRLQTLGSLVRDGASGQWAALAANGSLGLSSELLSAILSNMEQGESCGV